MASLATTENCPYCLQNINQGQRQYGPICNNGHRAHLNCIMNQFESNGRFNIDTWTCPLCRAPAYYSPDSEIPSLNQVLRRRFPRRIAELEAVPLFGPVEYSDSSGESEEEPDDSQTEELTREERLIQQYPFLGARYRENEGEYRELIMNGLTAQVRMRGVFYQTTEFVDTVDAAHMGAILLTQWYNMYNMARAYENEGDMEEVHSSISNQSPFFRALTMAILLGHARGFWNLDRDQVLLLTDMRRRATQADGVQTAGKRKKKKTRRKRGGKKHKTRKKRGGAVTEFIVKNDQASINAFFNEIRTRQINGSYVEHSPSDELGLEHLEEMMMESLLTGEYVEGIYGVTYAPNRNEGQYGRFFADYFDDMDSLTERLEIVSENNRFPNDVTQLQSAVEEQIILPHPGGESPTTIMDVDDLSGGRKRHRKKKTRKKRGGWDRTWSPGFEHGNIYYDCPNKPEGDWRYKKGIVISNVDTVISPLEAQEVEIKEMARSNRGDPTLVFNHTINPHEHDSRLRADQMCLEGFKPLKKNQKSQAAGRKKKTRKKRGGMERWRREPQEGEYITKDDIGYFYDCRGDNKSKYREHGIIIGDRDGNELTQPQRLKIARMEDSDFYDPQLILVDMALPEGERGLRWWRRRAQDYCNMGYKPQKRNDAKTGAGRKKKTRKKKTRKKRGAVKFGKNKTTAEIVNEGRKILKTTPQKKKRQMREQQIKLTGEKEFALFKKQAMDRMKIAFIKSFNQPPSDKDGKILSLVYKSLKQPLNKHENETIQDYRAENNNNKRKLVWMNNSLRQLREMSEKTKHQIYNTGDNPEVLKKNKPRRRLRKRGPATGLEIPTDKYMSPIKGPDTRYPELTLDIGERGKSHKNLFKGGRKKKTRRKKGSHHEPLLLTAAMVSKLINKKKKYKKRRTKKKSRRRR